MTTSKATAAYVKSLFLAVTLPVLLVGCDGRPAKSNQLISAARSGDVATVKQLLAAGVSPETRDLTGMSPLLAAGFGGHAEIVQLLLDKGADVNETHDGGATALQGAAMGPPPLGQGGKGNVEVVKLLLGRGAEVNAKDGMGSTALHQGALYRHPDVVRLLLAKGADVNAKDNLGYTPLHRAAQNNSLDVAKVLLEQEADVNAKTKDGQSPLACVPAQNGAKPTQGSLAAYGCRSPWATFHRP